MRSCKRRSLIAAATLGLTIGAAACGSNSSPNVADPSTTQLTPATSTPTSASTPTSVSAPTSTSTTLLPGLTPQVNKQLYTLFVNAIRTLDAIAGDPSGSPNDPRIAQYDTGAYLSSVQAGIAQYRTQNVIYKQTIFRLSQYRVIQSAPGGGWLADICDANNGDNFSATTGAQVTHTGFGSATQQFTAIPGPGGSWRINKIVQLPGTCAA
jgi:hypothetical protein